ncbi:MAG: TonB-dependent receptor [Gammaproteobacteria bacterium]
MRLPTDLKSRSYLSLAILGLALAGGAADAKPVAVDLPAQPLADSIRKLADLSGLSVSVDNSLLVGKTAPAVKGNLEPADALKRLLAGSRLDAVVSGDTVTITPSTARLGTVQVTGEGVEDGSEAVGYRVDTIHNLGPWGNVKAIDTPYTTFALSADLLQDAFVSNPFLIERLSPLTGLDEFQIGGQGSFVGFRGVGSFAPLINGMRGNDGLGMFTENVGSVEMLSGYSGFMYGVGAGGGLEVYTLKRPTKDPLTQVTVGHYALGGYHGDADISRQFADGMLGVRLNLMTEQGDTVIDNQTSRRRLASVGIDFNPLDQLKITADAYYGDGRLDGLRGSFSSYNSPILIPHLDHSALWNPAGTFSNVETKYFDLGVQYAFNDAIGARLAWSHKESESKTQSAFGDPILTGTTATGFTRSTYGTGQDPERTSGYAYLDGVFKTGFIEHRATAGFNGYDSTGRSAIFNNNGVRTTFFGGNENQEFAWGDKAGVAGMTVPDYYGNFLGFGKNSTSRVYNYIVGDTVKFTDQWTLMAGLTHSEIEQNSFNAISGVHTGAYKSNATTPTASLLFKPLPNLSTYVTYMQSLDAGQVVGDAYRNAGEVLSPAKSYEYEIGAKYELPGGALLTAALYRLDIASTLSVGDPALPTLTQDGRQINQGIDITISGKVTDSLTLFGGYAYIDAKIKKADDPLTVGTHPWGVPPHIFKMTADYATPLAGFSVTGGAYYNGSSNSTAVDSFDQFNVQYPGYVELDLGARYTTSLSSTKTTYRLNVSNLLDKNQWSYGDFNNPRSVSLSATVAF